MNRVEIPMRPSAEDPSPLWALHELLGLLRATAPVHRIVLLQGELEQVRNEDDRVRLTVDIYCLDPDDAWQHQQALERGGWAPLLDAFAVRNSAILRINIPWAWEV